MSERIARRLILALLRRIRQGELRLIEQGQTLRFGRPAPDGLTAEVRVVSPAAYRALLRGGEGLGTSYVDGLWECDDIVALIRLIARNFAPIDRARGRWLRPYAKARQLAWRCRRVNSRARARANISAHYDLGNDFYGVVLDETMTYSCAVYEPDITSLHDASVAKLERVCRKLDLAEGDSLLELGTGWGSLAIHAASRYGCHVTTVTLSREQYVFARRSVREANLEDRIEVVLSDYRDLHGSFDKLASLEMVEAVGWENLPTYFACCSRLLAPHGRMVLQAIVLPDLLHQNEMGSRGFINHFVPGAALPSLAAMVAALERRTDLRLTHLEDITPHYVPTLATWRANLERGAAQVEDLGYDEQLLRLWRFYLSYSEAGFAERRTGDVQIVLSKPGAPPVWPCMVESPAFALSAVVVNDAQDVPGTLRRLRWTARSAEFVMLRAPIGDRAVVRAACRDATFRLVQAAERGGRLDLIMAAPTYRAESTLLTPLPQTADLLP